MVNSKDKTMGSTGVRRANASMTERSARPLTEASSRVAQQELKDGHGENAVCRAASGDQKVADSSFVQQDQEDGHLWQRQRQQQGGRKSGRPSNVDRVIAVCGTANDSETVVRRAKEGGAGREHRDDKQVQQEPTDGARATAAHNEGLLYDFSLFPVREMLRPWEKDGRITGLWNKWSASQEEKMSFRSTFLATATAVVRRVEKRQARKRRSVRKRSELMDAINFGKKERARSSKDGCTRWKYEYKGWVYVTDETSQHEVVRWQVTASAEERMKAEILLSSWEAKPEIILCLPVEEEIQKAKEYMKALLLLSSVGRGRRKGARKERGVEGKGGGGGSESADRDRGSGTGGWGWGEDEEGAVCESEDAEAREQAKREESVRGEDQAARAWKEAEALERDGPLERLQHEGSEDGIKKPHVHTTKEGDTKVGGGDVRKRRAEARRNNTEGILTSVIERREVERAKLEGVLRDVVAMRYLDVRPLRWELQMRPEGAAVV